MYSDLEDDSRVVVAEEVFSYAEGGYYRVEIRARLLGSMVGFLGISSFWFGFLRLESFFDLWYNEG